MGNPDGKAEEAEAEHEEKAKAGQQYAGLVESIRRAIVLIEVALAQI